MKKIALFSLIACLGFIDGSFAAGQACRKTSTGKVVCNYIDRGGASENDLCFKKKASSDEANPDSNIWESQDDDWWKKKIGADCTNGKPGAKSAKCVKNYFNKAGNWMRSCAAYECKDNYLLYTTNERSEIEVVGTSQKVGSQGLCRERSYLKNLCDVGCGCDKNEKCVLNPVKVKNHGNIVDAFIGEELCVCVAKDGGNGSGQQPLKPNEDELSECYLRLSFDVPCVGVPTYKAYTKISLTKAQVATIEGLTCNGSTDVTNTVLGNASIDVNALINNVNSIRSKLEALLCKGGTIILPSGSDGGDVAAAEETLKDFFTWAADKDNQSVWKDAEGNFNTARLASDLTAGVVLGTVGGVVSAVVIKKKQVEKGFDALHCAIGGQTVADWGDTMNIGFTRY